jgi:hypothetical protein
MLTQRSVVLSAGACFYFGAVSATKKNTAPYPQIINGTCFNDMLSAVCEIGGESYIALDSL